MSENTCNFRIRLFLILLPRSLTRKANVFVSITPKAVFGSEVDTKSVGRLVRHESLTRRVGLTIDLQDLSKPFFFPGYDLRIFYDS